MDLQNSLVLIFFSSSPSRYTVQNYDPALGTARVKLLTTWSLGEFVRDSSLFCLIFSFFFFFSFFLSFLIFSHPFSIAPVIHQTVAFQSSRKRVKSANRLMPNVHFIKQLSTGNQKKRHWIKESVSSILEYSLHQNSETVNSQTLK